MSNGALTNCEQMNLMLEHMLCFMAQGFSAVPSSVTADAAAAAAAGIPPVEIYEI